MEKYINNINTMSLDELSEYIIKNMDIYRQIEIVGEIYRSIFFDLEINQRKEVILSSLKQMPEEIIEEFMENYKTR